MTAPKTQQPPAPQPAPQPQPAQTHTTASAQPPPPPSPVTAPDVTQLALSAARQKLRGAGLVTEIKYVPSQEPANTVVSQAPKAGETLRRGDHVLVNASLGPKPARQAPVPDVVGQDEQTAMNTVEQAGFTVDEVDVAVGSSDQDGVVQDEQPAGGANAPAGSDVTIYVGRFSAESG